MVKFKGQYEGRWLCAVDYVSFWLGFDVYVGSCVCEGVYNCCTENGVASFGGSVRVYEGVGVPCRNEVADGVSSGTGGI